MKKLYSGFTLIEVLISLVILSLVLLGFDALEIFGIREINNAYHFTLAENQIKSMTEVLHTSQDHTQQIAFWTLQNQVLLPHGRGLVTGGYPNYLVTVFWGESTTETTCQKMQVGKRHCLVSEIHL